MTFFIVAIVVIVVVVAIAALALGNGDSSPTAFAPPKTSSPPRAVAKTPALAKSRPLPPPPAQPPLSAVERQRPRTQAALVQARADITRRQNEVEAALSRFKSTDFKALTNLHFEAFQTADIAHALYTQTRSSSKSVSSAIEKIDQHLDSLKNGVARGDSRYAESRRLALTTRRDLVTDAKTLQGHTASLLKGVQSLNANTHTLKTRIRTECGKRGQEWFNRLEGRKRRQ